MTTALIEVAELAEALSGSHPPLLIDAQYWLGEPDRGGNAYAEAHVPGAVHLSVDEVFSAPPRPDRVGGRHPLPELARLQEQLRAAGLDQGQSVVVYDQGPSLGAARAWWVLRDAGLCDVRVLNGGLRAWREAGHPTQTAAPTPSAGDVVIERLGHQPQVDAEAVAAALGAGQQVFDVRAPERFRGEQEPMDPVAGHIPGSQSLPATVVQGEGGRFLAPDDLREALTQVQPGDVLSCGSGITAAKVALAAAQAGIEGVRIYPGSWSDWISDPQRPIATGE